MHVALARWLQTLVLAAQVWTVGVRGNDTGESCGFCQCPTPGAAAKEGRYLTNSIE